MPHGPLVSQVIVVPRNGLANRLQAWASAAVLAAEWDAPLRVVWEAEDILPAPADQLFAPSVVSRWFVPGDTITEVAGGPHQGLPRYLARAGNAVILAGHERGEQSFMEALPAFIAESKTPTSLVIIAGGNFHLPGNRHPGALRGIFYRQLVWSSHVEERVASAPEAAAPYVALHVRQTDRSREAPTPGRIRDALADLASRQPIRSLFIAADSTDGHHLWAEKALALGFQPWSLPAIDRERSRSTGIVDAAADWLLLSHAEAIVHSAASTFSTEATLASGHPETSLALTAPASVRRLRDMTTFARSAVRLPLRRLRGE